MTNKNTVLQIRLSSKDKERFMEMAAAVDMSLSEWVLSKCRSDVPTVESRKEVTTISGTPSAPVVRKHHPSCKCAVCKEWL